MGRPGSSRNRPGILVAGIPDNEAATSTYSLTPILLGKADQTVGPDGLRGVVRAQVELALFSELYRCPVEVYRREGHRFRR